MEQNRINQRVEEALNSLDGIQKAGPGPFFYTRVMARMESREKTGWEILTTYITRPYVIASVIGLMVMLNVTAILRESGASDAVPEQTEISLADEYQNASTAFYDYTNTEP